MSIVALSFKQRVGGIIALTPVLLFIMYILIHATQDQQWGGGFWETWLMNRFAWGPEVAHAAVFWVRKTIHFTGYGTISLLFWLYYYLWRLPKPAFFGVLSCAVIASLDEYTQSLSSFRTGKPEDVLIDVCGAVVFSLGVSWWLKRRKSVES
jgi:hypothetical protein